MNSTHSRGRGPRSAWTAASAALLFLASFLGCSSEGPSTHVNQPPTATITSGPVEGSETYYQVDLEWSGNDPDGRVVRFEYALDPPAAFTEEEIDQGGPGITSDLIPGSGGAPDTTRVTKVGDTGTAHFDWIHTEDTAKTFRFSTPEPDSTVEGGTTVPTGRFHGMHAVYLRAIDDHEAASVPARVAFTATTVAPSATMTRPNIESEILTLGTSARFEWTGHDPDGAGTQIPTGYYYKLLRLDTLVPPVGITVLPSPYILYQKGGAWSYAPGESTGLNFQFQPPGSYIFGVRAVDEAGAVEPFLAFGRNAFKFICLTSGGTPTLRLYTAAGTFTFRGTGGTAANIELPTSTDLAVTANCSAEEYGGACNGFRWGVDIPDLDGTAGWSAWTTQLSFPPIGFSTPGVHVLYVETRDDVGSMTLGVITINVIEFPFDREVLYVDDYRNATYPNPAGDDAFWRGLFQDYASYAGWDPSAFDEIHVFGDGDAQTFDPAPLPLSELGRYKLVIWSDLGTGVNAVTSLVKTATINPWLGLYLRGGGKVWLSGEATMMAITISPNGINGDPEYPKISIAPGQFCYDFLKMHSTKVNNDKGQSANNTLMRVIPYPGRPAIFDTLTVDTGKLNPIAVGLKRGVPFADAVFDPIFAESEPGFRGNLDSLYVYGAAGPFYGTGGSIYQGKLVAMRWHDPDPAREHGRTMWFGCPLYYFYDDQAKGMFRKAVDWFREESPSPAISRRARKAQ
jgi:hypothetical protein